MSDNKVSLSNVQFDLIMMPGDDGYNNRTMPKGYRYVSIINGTDNAIEVYADRRTKLQADLKDYMVRVPNYTQQTIPIREDAEYTFVYYDGGAVGAKKATVIFTVENLGLNGSLGSPSSTGGVTVVSDQVGLARMNQLPANLSPSGGVKVTPDNTAGTPLHVESLQLPAALAAGGGLRVVPENTQATPIFVNANNIGSGTIPVCDQYVIGTVAAAIGGPTTVSELLLQAEPGNTVDILIGNATKQVIRLQPGASVNIPVTNLNLVFAKASAAGTANLNVFGRG